MTYKKIRSMALDASTKIEREALMAAIAEAGGIVPTAAAALRCPVSTLRVRLRALGIRYVDSRGRPRKKNA